VIQKSSTLPATHHTLADTAEEAFIRGQIVMRDYLADSFDGWIQFAPLGSLSHCSPFPYTPTIINESALPQQVCDECNGSNWSVSSDGTCANIFHQAALPQQEEPALICENCEKHMGDHHRKEFSDELWCYPEGQEIFRYIHPSASPEPTPLLGQDEPEEDENTCASCHKTTDTPLGLEPTKYCNLCAQERVYDFESQLTQALTSLADAQKELQSLRDKESAEVIVQAQRDALFEVAYGIANANWKEWLDGLNTPEEFIRWAKSISSHVVSKASVAPTKLEQEK